MRPRVSFFVVCLCVCNILAHVRSYHPALMSSLHRTTPWRTYRGTAVLRYRTAVGTVGTYGTYGTVFTPILSGYLTRINETRIVKLR